MGGRDTREYLVGRADPRTTSPTYTQASTEGKRTDVEKLSAAFPGEAHHEGGEQRPPVAESVGRPRVGIRHADGEHEPSAGDWSRPPKARFSRSMAASGPVDRDIGGHDGDVAGLGLLTLVAVGASPPMSSGGNHEGDLALSSE
jgi:hypothetical protein